MAPNLAVSQHALIHGTSLQPAVSSTVAALAARCSVRSVKAARANLRIFGTTRAPRNGSGRPRLLPSAVAASVLQLLQETSDLTLQELAEYIEENFNLVVSLPTISRALRHDRWSKKVIRRKAKEQDPDLRDFFLYRLSRYKSYHLVYVDESGCDGRAGFRRTGWAPIGSTPVQTTEFHRGERHHILPAYTQDGILFSTVYQGSTDAVVFGDFLEQLLPWCGKYPEPRSVLVMDNASFHRTRRVRQLCAGSGVILMYLPPYSPDLNPIEEFFAEMKSFIKRYWKRYKEHGPEGLGEYLEWCVDMVGSKTSSARGHFRHCSGLEVEERGM